MVSDQPWTHILDEQGRIMPADPRLGTENERRGKLTFLLASSLWSVDRTRNLNMAGVVAEAIAFSFH